MAARPIAMTSARAAGAGLATLGANTFTGAQTVNGALSATGLISTTQTALSALLGAGANNNGAALLFAGSSTNKNWYIGNQIDVGDALTISQTASAGGTTVASSTVLYQITSTAFAPFSTNAVSSGSSAKRWSTVFGVAADFSGDRFLTLTNQTSAAAASVGTLTNAPAAGNPTFWLKTTINGVSIAIPGWPG